MRQRKIKSILTGTGKYFLKSPIMLFHIIFRFIVNPKFSCRLRLFDYMACLVLYEHVIEVFNVHTIFQNIIFRNIHLNVFVILKKKIIIFRTLLQE